jgi:acyl-CoA synthetase (NDP forming)
MVTGVNPLTTADAERAVEYPRMKINAWVPQARFHTVTVGALVDRYMEDEMPVSVREDTCF